MNSLQTGIITRETNGKPIIGFKYLVIKREQYYHAICLDLEIIGTGNDINSSIEDMVVLLHDELCFRAKTANVAVIEADEIYFKEFYRINDKSKIDSFLKGNKINTIRRDDLNKILSRNRKKFSNSNLPTGYKVPVLI